MPGEAFTLDAPGSHPAYRPGEEQGEAVGPAPQPVRQDRTRDATEGVAQAKRGASALVTDCQPGAAAGVTIPAG